jgi:Protein of unknown function (DUF2829)
MNKLLRVWVARDRFPSKLYLYNNKPEADEFGNFKIENFQDDDFMELPDDWLEEVTNDNSPYEVYIHANTSDIGDANTTVDSASVVDRMIAESGDLRVKIDKLGQFIESSQYELLTPTIQALVKAQYSAMMSYYSLLNERYMIMCGRSDSLSADLDFGTAIKLLEAGLCVARDGWNGNGLFVIKQVPAHIPSEIIPKMQSLPPKAKELILKSRGYVNYTSQCLLFNSNTGRADSWTPSISDVFANDWYVVSH